MRKTLNAPFAVASIAIGLALGSPSLGHASPRDDLAAAKRATSLLHKEASMLIYCEPCGDAAPGMPFHPALVGAPTARGTNLFGVAIGGRETALHHIYLRTDKRSFRNLATLVDLPSQDAPPLLEVVDSGDGEVIAAPRTSRPEERAAPMAASEEVVLAPDPSPAGHSAVALPQKNTGGLFGLVLLGLGLSSIASGGMLWLLFLLRFRRRSEALPRALTLLK